MGRLTYPNNLKLNHQIIQKDSTSRTVTRLNFLQSATRFLASANQKSLETSKPKTTSDFNAMNLSRGKQAPIITSIKTRIESIKNE
jgi:hypothetical protein